MPFVRLITITALFCLAVTATGCRNADHSSSSSGPVEITFWNGFTGPDGTTMERIVRRFNKENPHVRVKMQIIPWGTYYDKVTLGLAYGGAPDVFIMHVTRFPEYANYGSLDPVGDLVQTGSLDAQDFAPNVWKATFWKGTQYAIPLDCHPIGLYYNKTLFKKAGIVDSQGNAKPPATLAEFLDAARRLTKDTNGDGRTDQWGFAYTWIRTNSYTFLNQFDTTILEDNMRRSALGSPRALQAMDLMSSFIYKHGIAPKPEGQDSWIGFQTGKVAMALEGVYMLASLESQKNLDYAGAVCPVFGKRPAVWASSHLMAMPKGIEPEKRKAAWEFICYLSDNSLEWAKGGQVPVRKSILRSPEFRKLDVQYQFSKELPYVVYEPPSISFNQIAPFADAAFEAVLCRIKPTAEALGEAARRIDGVLARE